MQSAKMRCDVVCTRSFHDEAGCIVSNPLKSVWKVPGASGEEGIAIVKS